MYTVIYLFPLMKLVNTLLNAIVKVSTGADPGGGPRGPRTPPLGVPTLERINTIYVKGLTSHGPR